MYTVYDVVDEYRTAQFDLPEADLDNASGQ